jgi:hypothetical protein
MVVDEVPFAPPADGRLGRLAIGILAPLAVAAIAYALWWISDRLLVIGPLDRAAFGWVVVIPVWLSTPVVAAVAWGPLGRLDTRIAGVVVGGSISAIAAATFWQSVSTSACEYGPRQTPAELLVPSIILGLIIGGGIVASAWQATDQIDRGRRWRAVVLGAGSNLGFVFIAIFVAGVILVGTGCQRPPL